MRKTLLSIVGVTLLMGALSCTGSQIPASEALEKMGACKKDYSSSLENSRKLIEQGLKDSYFSTDLQEQIYRALYNAEESCRDYNGLIKYCPEKVPMIGLPVNDVRWYILIKENVTGFDGDPPTLEKALSKEHSGIKVDAIYSFAEESSDAMLANTALNILFD